jgi:hypothetical protein
MFAFGDDDTEAEPSFNTTVGSVVEVPDGDTTAGPSGDTAGPSGDTDPMGTSVSAFLQGSGTMPPAEPATIAIPRLPDAITGTATFRRSILRPTSCVVRPDVGAPTGVEITVTNRNNSRSVRCVFNITDLEIDDHIALHPDALAEIGDLTDAPLPVQLTW